MDIDTSSFDDLGDSPSKAARTKPLATIDVIGSTDSRPPPAPTLTTSRPSTPCLPTSGYILVSQKFLGDILKCLVTLKKKVKNIEKRVQLASRRYRTN